MRQTSKKGFALVSVLVILLVLTFMSAIIMDLTLNSHNTTMNVIEDKKLYNAAQSGVEYGIALLVAHRDDLDDEVKTGISGITFSPANAAHLNAVRATINDGTILDNTQPDTALFGTGITVRVDILDCNYEPSSNYDPFLPPVRLATTGGGGAASSLPGGTSAIIDPSHALVFGGGPQTLAFVVRSRATMSGKTKTIETMIEIQR